MTFEPRTESEFGRRLAASPDSPSARGSIPSFEIDAGSQHRANRSRNRRSVAVPSRTPVDRTRVHAGAATDAFQRAPEIGPRELSRSSIVDQNDMYLVSWFDAVHM